MSYAQRKKQRRAAARALTLPPAEEELLDPEADGYYQDGMPRLERAAKKARELTNGLAEQFGYETAAQIAQQAGYDYFERVAAEFLPKVADEYARAAQHQLTRREKHLADRLRRTPNAALEQQLQLVQAAFAGLRDPAVQLRLLVKVQHLGADPGWRRLLADIVECAKEATHEVHQRERLRSRDSPLDGPREGLPGLAERIAEEMAPYTRRPAIFKEDA